MPYRFTFRHQASFLPAPRRHTLLRRRATGFALGLAFAALAAALPSAAQAATLTVGKDAACDFAALQPAIDAAPDGALIEVEAGIYFGPFTIDEKSLAIHGGFDRCDGARVDISRLDGFEAVQILHATAKDERRRLDLENLYFTNGRSTSENGGSSGGAIYVGGLVDLKLDGVYVVANEAHAGGGIYARPFGFSAPSVRIERSMIAGNRARSAANGTNGRGGGIYYWHAGESPENLTIIDSAIEQNHADSYGGGIYATNATLIVDRDIAVPTQKFARNTARRGGAIAAWRSSIQLDGVRFPVAPEIGLEFFDNRASEDGGAIHLRLSSLSADAVSFLGNVADGRGGAIAALESSTVVVGHGLDACGEATGCNVFEANRAADWGGAVMLHDSSGAFLAVRADDNASPLGGAFVDAEAGGSVEVWSAALTKNRGKAAIFAFITEALDVRSTTFYGNDFTDTTVWPFDVEKRPNVSQSIFFDNGGDSYVKGEIVDFGCNMIDHDFDWPADRIVGSRELPRFVVPDSFRLRPHTPEHACGYLTPSAPVDIDYDLRPIGLSFDVGADER